MPNHHPPRPPARSRPPHNNFATHVNRHPADFGHPAGDPLPTGPSELSSLPVDTRMPCVVDYPAKTAARPPTYILRWAVTTREKRPWSETVSPTIGA